ncbi:hypothetical protein [Arthrobacter rhizosphaerae]|uniref:hypothetical protein n=1 Tax=Arthrobacter rhizosphaerae TaxID=2855490 RepID=UPI001FF354F6|nr:hypothetical protein [Arthrobacter rhizosphaerae]
MAIPVLSRTDREFLQHLAFRQAGPADEPCWVHRKPRNRWHLIVWTMMRSYERSPFVKNGKTLARLEATELIEYGPEMNLPEPYAREHGSTIMLTTAGYAAIGSTAGLR